ncbi:MAG: hypothetical protein HYY84_10365 [Deltaproteobacteria bacterium]|nr:hypothetical protein [Deltaproteobacteria bacterium]
MLGTLHIARAARFSAYLAVTLSAAACDVVRDPAPSDGRPPGAGRTADGGIDPNASSGDAGLPDIDAGPCGLGGLTGRACAPDRATAVSSATVTLEGTDCAGSLYRLDGRSGSDGRWSFSNVPSGEATLTITVGSYVQRQTVRVTAGVTTALVDAKTCFNPQSVRMAVVTGQGDKIEDFLTALGFSPDVIDGKPTSSRPIPPAAAFLADASRLGQYQIVFIDCAAFTRNDRLDLGPSTTAILQNLRAFVLAGGSLYGSDWAGVILARAFPDDVGLRLASGGDTHASPIQLPFTTTALIGFSEQQIAATVPNAALAAYLGGSSVTITFPRSPPSNHWALLAPSPANVSNDIVGPALPCASSSCASPASAPLPDVPLSISFRADPTRTRGGNVVFTSFHNLAQSTDDVKHILEHLIFRL